MQNIILSSNALLNFSSIQCCTMNITVIIVDNFNRKYSQVAHNSGSQLVNQDPKVGRGTIFRGLKASDGLKVGPEAIPADNHCITQS